MSLFRYDWFTKYAEKNFDTYLQKFKGKPDLKFLEIGSFEGRGTLWLLENVLVHSSCNITCVDTFQGDDNIEMVLGLDTRNYFNIFMNNIEKYKSKIILIKGKSQEQLRRDNLRYPIYDFVYIDGSHKAYDVIEDAVLSFRLLKSGGIMIFDDYEWKYPGKFIYDVDSPKIAIDAFLSVFIGQYKLLHKMYQVVIEKIL